uniref:Uncharacterized protein n=1 Tax=Anopheles atroparvus TaxID=41427 RepID=A0A182JH95_ANOAO
MRDYDAFRVASSNGSAEAACEPATRPFHRCAIYEADKSSPIPSPTQLLTSDILPPPLCQTRSEVSRKVSMRRDRDAIGEDVYRAKRKFRPEEWSAANAILDLLAQLKSARQGQAPTQTPRATTTTTTTTTAAPRVRARADRSSREDDDVPQFNPDGTIMLQLPGKLFGNATNFVLAAAKLFGDFIQNTAIRTARFMQLFQPIAGRNLFIQIPTPSPPGGDN